MWVAEAAAGRAPWTGHACETRIERYRRVSGICCNEGKEPDCKARIAWFFPRRSHSELDHAARAVHENRDNVLPRLEFRDDEAGCS